MCQCASTAGLNWRRRESWGVLRACAPVFRGRAPPSQGNAKALFIYRPLITPCSAREVKYGNHPYRHQVPTAADAGSPPTSPFPGRHGRSLGLDQAVVDAKTWRWRSAQFRAWPWCMCSLLMLVAKPGRSTWG